MAKKSKLLENRIISLGLMIVVSVGILSAYQFTRKAEHTVKQLTTPVAIEPIDSSSCIACHTSESVIGSVVMEFDEGHGSEGA